MTKEEVMKAEGWTEEEYYDYLDAMEELYYYEPSNNDY